MQLTKRELAERLGAAGTAPSGSAKSKNRADRSWQAQQPFYKTLPPNNPKSQRVMNANHLQLSTERDTQPSPDLSPEPRALWLAKKGRWHEVHDLYQEIPGTKCSWIRAWLHRQERDFGNACYWYSRAGKLAPGPEASLEEEWFQLQLDDRSRGSGRRRLHLGERQSQCRRQRTLRS